MNKKEKCHKLKTNNKWKSRFNHESLCLIIFYLTATSCSSKDRERERGIPYTRECRRIERLHFRSSSFFCSKCYSFPIEREAAVLKRRATTFPFRKIRSRTRVYTNVFAEWVIVAVCPVTSEAENRIEKTLDSLFIQSSRYSRLWKYILSCPPFRLFESVSRGHSLMKATVPTLLQLVCPNLYLVTSCNRSERFIKLAKRRARRSFILNNLIKRIFGKQFENRRNFVR